MNTVSFYDQVTSQLDMGQEVDVIYLDFSKACDIVSHEILSIKLEGAGLDQSTVSYRARFHRGSFQPYSKQRNLVEKVKQQCLKPGKEQMGNQCEKHQENFKLFCEADGEAICVVCRESQDHCSHTVVPIEEAASHYKDKVEQQRERIKSDCEKLHCFVCEEVQLLLQRREEQERETLKSLEENVAQLSKQSSSLHKLISEREKKSLQAPAELLKDVKRTLDRCCVFFFPLPSRFLLGAWQEYLLGRAGLSNNRGYVPLRSKNVELQVAKAVFTELKTVFSIPGMVEMLRKFRSTWEHVRLIGSSNTCGNGDFIVRD
ncbi:E3 ubiquitin-protein ligase TRIM17 isoform X2 [Alligator mississippiensis]|uniref:E3 ubiquitin-protein ligase TRIM17 isoform X2 n=1 Tax=Alligator mississippiensis TaxID=8496 RepID=UPI0009072520|nr:E3 ubiquitin-protein ligase TRIM17 isoform X2 [Alligator mississippiensis]